MRAILHETMTGEFVSELGFSAAGWDQGICRADSVKVTLPAYTGRKWFQYMIPQKYSISISEDDGRVRGAGILGVPESASDEDGAHHLVFPGTGIESYFERRRVQKPDYWPLLDSGGYPIESRDMTFSGFDYGTIMKLVYQQALSHLGAEMPVAFQSNRAGSRVQSYTAVDGVGVQEAVNDLAELAGGVEWDWVPSLDGNDNLTWNLVTATDAEQEISSTFQHTWQSGGTAPDVRGLDFKVSPEFMCSSAVVMGGKDADSTMAARAMDMTLPNAGIPLTEEWDTSHSSVSDQATLNGFAQKRVIEGQAPIQYWSFEVRSARAYGLRKGDWCTIEVADHWGIPDGSYRRRIVELSGDSDSGWFGLVVAGEHSW